MQMEEVNMSSPTIASRNGIITNYKPIWEKTKQERKKLEQIKKEIGLSSSPTTTISNCKSIFKTISEEKEGRQKIVEEKLKIFRNILPDILKGLREIKDPRNPRTTDHKLTCVLLYGLLMFVLQMSSRREANRIMTMPQFIENLKTMFPEIESLPHGDTVNRVLSQIKVEEIQKTQIELVRELIYRKKFNRYKIGRRYMIAVDGTQKFSRDIPWSEEALQRTKHTKEGKKKQYYVYVLEANLVFKNGLTIPLLCEILEYTKGDTKENKQDCEINAFKRLATRLKKLFPRLPITVLLDGLYPNGPIMELCKKNNWEYMMVLKDDSLKQVWTEAYGINKLETKNKLNQTWGGRSQHFWWVNGIEYDYGNNGQFQQIVNVVVCEETWQEVDPKTGEIVEKRTRYAWISSKPLNRKNVSKRCNLMGRYRWSIESDILVEKHHGYQSEHCFSKNWNAMKGYHYLMRLAYLINILTQYSVYIHEKIKVWGVCGIMWLILDTLTAPWLDKKRIKKITDKRPQMRLI